MFKRRPSLVRRARQHPFHAEALEPRRLLANQSPIGVADHYEVDEDAVLTVASSPVAVAPLLSRGSSWDYFDELTNELTLPVENYPRDAANQPWYAEDFSTATSDPAVGDWRRATAPFAQGDIAGFAGQAVSPLAGNAFDHTTDLFRTTFTLPAALAGIERLWMTTLADDGGVLYINGQEVARERMPSGAVTPSTLTESSIAEQFASATIAAPAVLHAGENTLAYELHQNTRDSTDRGFDLELTSSNLDRRGVLVNDHDPENQQLAASVVDPPAHGTLVLQPNGQFVYTPDVDFAGEDAFTYRVTDDGAAPAASAPTAVTISVHDLPDTLVARDDSYTLHEDERFAVGNESMLVALGSDWNYLMPMGGVDPASNDADFNTTWYSQGIAGGDYDGPTFATGGGLLGYGGIAFQDPPTTQLPYPGAGGNYTGYFTRHFTFNGDPEMVADLLVDILADDGAIIYLNGVEAGRVNMTAGADTFTQLAASQADESKLQTIALHGALRAGDNVLAVSVHSFNRLNEDLGFDLQLRAASGTNGVLANDTTDYAPLSLSVVTSPAHGQLSLQPSGLFVYTPAANYNGADSFTYRVQDAATDSATATVSLTILAVNDPPTALPQMIYAREDSPLHVSHASTPPQIGAILGTSTWTYFDQLKLPQDPGAVLEYPTDPAHPASDWNDASFDPATSNAAWKTAAAPFEAGDIDAFLGQATTPLEEDGVTTYLFRTTFDVNDVDAASIAMAAIDFVTEDGGVVYLNGSEYNRYNMPPGVVTPKTYALQAVTEQVIRGQYNVAGLLHPGSNTLAVEVHRAADTDSPHDFLRVSEIEYDPADPTPAEIAAGFTSHEQFEFLEFVNVHRTASINLDSVHITGGLGDDLDFPAIMLAPGERVVAVQNIAAFRARYGNGPVIVGQYNGGLHNDGEQLTIRDGSAILQQFTYHDDETPGWYPQTDDGYSLVIVDPTAPLSAWNDPAQWRPSAALGGSPGAADPGESTARLGEDAGFSIALALQPGGGVLEGATDVESQPLTARLIDAPQHGTVDLAADGTFTYAPARNYFGIDTFTFAAVDDDATNPQASAPTTVTILVAPDAPASLPPDTATCEDLDWNQNGAIDRADVAAFVHRLGENVAPGTAADFNGDGKTTLADLMRLQARSGESCAPASAAGAIVARAIASEIHPAAADAAIVAWQRPTAVAPRLAAVRTTAGAANREFGGLAGLRSRPASASASVSSLHATAIVRRRSSGSPRHAASAADGLVARQTWNSSPPSKSRRLVRSSKFLSR
jgi:hypothetical protein